MFSSNFGVKESISNLKNTHFIQEDGANQILKFKKLFGHRRAYRDVVLNFSNFFLAKNFLKEQYFKAIICNIMARSGQMPKLMSKVGLFSR